MYFYNNDLFFYLQVPDHLNAAQDGNTKSDDYKLVVEGNSYGRLHGSLFFHEKDLRLARKHVKILLQTEREIYTEGQNGKLSLSNSEYLFQYKLRFRYRT